LHEERALSIGISASSILIAPLQIHQLENEIGALKGLPSFGANVGLHMRYLSKKTPQKIWFSVGHEYGAYFPRVRIEIPAGYTEKGAFAAFEEVHTPGGKSSSVRQWFVKTGCSLPVGTSFKIDPYVGLGITETTLATLFAPLPLYNDSLGYGTLALQYGFVKAVAPTIRLGVDLCMASARRSTFGIGVLGVYSASYISGACVLLPSTTSSSSGEITGSLSYLGLCVSYRFDIGKAPAFLFDPGWPHVPARSE